MKIWYWKDQKHPEISVGSSYPQVKIKSWEDWLSLEEFMSSSEDRREMEEGECGVIYILRCSPCIKQI